MKKVCLLLTLLFLLLFPKAYALGYYDEGEVKDKVVIYFFKGDGCGFCAQAEDFFDTIESLHGEIFELKKYEVWYDRDNAELMEDVSEYLDADVDGVPFIVIGDEYWNGFNQRIGERIYDVILEEFDKDAEDRFDVMQALEDEEFSDDDDDYYWDDEYYDDEYEEFEEFFAELEDVEDFEDFLNLGPVKYILLIPITLVLIFVMSVYRKIREINSNYSDIVSRGRFR